VPHVSRFSRRGKSPKVAERAMKFNRYLRLSSLMGAAPVARADALYSFIINRVDTWA